MSAANPAQRPPKLLQAFTTMGDVLYLQILFVVAAIPVVTILPTAIALQRSLRAVMVEGKPKVTAQFIIELKWALAKTWRIAIVLPLLMIAGFTSIVFWASAHSTVGTIALSILLPLLGLATASYIAFLATAMMASHDSSFKDLARQTLAVAKKHPLQLAACIVVMTTWFMLLGRLPTMSLIGTGLVPAALAWWVADPQIKELRKRLSAS